MLFSTPPYQLQEASVRRVMLQVLLALLPAVATYVWVFGAIILVQLTWGTLVALLAEAVMLYWRGKPWRHFLGDGSVVVTAWLVVLAFPPLAPWWLTATGILFAVVIAKHLYGGLGQNPFNPAMVGFAVCIVSFPALMSQWPPVDLADGFYQRLALVFGQAPRLDAMTGATPLDALKTGLKLADHEVSVAALRADPHIFGMLGGRGWEWISLAYLLGGLWLWQRRIIRWQTPLAFLASISLISGILWLWQPMQFASPLFHLASGGVMLGAFFIITDPVSGCTTPRGQLIFGALAGLLVYIIRVFGGYPDGVAFAVLLLNLCVPVIDMLTQPRIFGLKERR